MFNLDNGFGEEIPYSEEEEYERLNLWEDWGSDSESGQITTDIMDFMPDWNSACGNLNLSDIGEIVTSIWTFDDLDEDKHGEWWDYHDSMPNSCCAWLLWLEDGQWAVLVGGRYFTDDQQEVRGPALHASPNVFRAIEAATDLSIEERNRFLQVVHLLYPYVPYAYPDWFVPEPEPPWEYLHRQYGDTST